jgi:hypothetical protein
LEEGGIFVASRVASSSEQDEAEQEEQSNGRDDVQPAQEKRKMVSKPYPNEREPVRALMKGGAPVLQRPGLLARGLLLKADLRVLSGSDHDTIHIPVAIGK